MTCLNYPKQLTLSRNQIASMVINNFHYPADYILDTLDQYYILHWTPKYFFDNMVDGTVSREGTEFLVIYQDSSPAVIRKITQLKLSFRAPKKEFGLRAYVIVKAYVSNSDFN